MDNAAALSDEDETMVMENGDGESRIFDCIPSKSGILYTTKELSNRKGRRNILSQQPRIIALPQTQSESFGHILKKK